MYIVTLFRRFAYVYARKHFSVWAKLDLIESVAGLIVFKIIYFYVLEISRSHVKKKNKGKP